MRIALGIILALALVVCAVGPALAQDEQGSDVNYSITSVETQQMSNAVQVEIKADGMIYPDMDRMEAENSNYSLLSQRGWRYDLEVAKPITELTMHFYNARVQVNSFVPVGKYPISHIEFTPSGSGNSYQADMRVCFYTSALISHVKSRYWDDTSAIGVDWGGNARLEAVIGEDDRSVVITVISDRLPDTPDHRSAEGLKDSDKELSIVCDGENYYVHARNALLSEFVRKLDAVSERKVELDPSVERLVTAELPKLSFDDLLQTVCRCYGLTTAGSPADDLVIREAVVQSDSKYGPQETQTLRPKWLRADKALCLLPNFLTRCVRVDKGNNQLVFSSSPEFADKLRSDLALVDLPNKAVEVETTLVEVSPTVDVNSALGLSYANTSLNAAIDVPSVQFGIVKSDASPAQFSANLSALTESAMCHNVSNAKLSVLSGEQGSLFAGVNKYIQVRDRYGDRESAIPVQAGLNLTVKPLVTGSRVQLDLTAEVSNINVIDPLTNLPVVDTRKASGTFQVRPGETIIVGGLDQLQTHFDRRRLPILGYLPVIGSLFTRTVKHHENSRLMLLLTPRIVEDSVATNKL